jgi:hypothetical protein
MKQARQDGDLKKATKLALEIMQYCDKIDDANPIQYEHIPLERTEEGWQEVEGVKLRDARREALKEKARQERRKELDEKFETRLTSPLGEMLRGKAASLQKESGEDFQSALMDIYKNLAQLQSLFVVAQEQADDPVKKAILTGMWSDFFNWKNENWTKYFRMLESDLAKAASK